VVGHPSATPKILVRGGWDSAGGRGHPRSQSDHPRLHILAGWLATHWPVKGFVFWFFSFFFKIIKYKINIIIIIFFVKYCIYPKEYIFLSFFRGIGIPLRKGICIPMGIPIPRNRPLPNKRMAIPFQWSIPRTKRGHAKVKDLMRIVITFDKYYITLNLGI
jgi:hypothetical protein